MAVCIIRGNTPTITMRTDSRAFPLTGGDRRAQIGAVAVLAASLALALVNLTTEVRVSAMRAILSAQQSEVEVAQPWLVDERPSAALSPRAALLRGMARISAAVDELPPRRAALLARAAADLDRTKGVRRWWADADVAESYRAMLAEGTRSPAALAALSRSYEAAPFLRGAAPWRIRYGATLWSDLPASTHARIVAETVWLARASGRTYGYATGLVAGTPAEAPVDVLLAETAS